MHAQLEQSPQMFTAALECEPLAVATSLINSGDPGERGAVSLRRLLFRCLNRPLATTMALSLFSPVSLPP